MPNNLFLLWASSPDAACDRTHELLLKFKRASDHEILAHIVSLVLSGEREYATYYHKNGKLVETHQKRHMMQHFPPGFELDDVPLCIEIYMFKDLKKHVDLSELPDMKHPNANVEEDTVYLSVVMDYISRKGGGVIILFTCGAPTGVKWKFKHYPAMHTLPPLNA